MIRRDFLKFISASAAITSIDQGFSSEIAKSKYKPKLSEIDYEGIYFSDKDDVVLSNELNYQVLIRWQDLINEKDYFGFNNDYLNFVAFPDKKNEGILWVNHESTDRFMILGHNEKKPSKEEIEKEMYSVGGSLIHIIKNIKTQRWELVKNSSYNRRVSGLTLIPFANNVDVKGRNIAMGTLGNCAGGKTPWNTILTCEENYDLFYGETKYKDGKTEHIESEFGWENYYQNPPEHYGWVVEINPLNGEAKKHTSMGRMAHECATTTRAKNKKVVVYTGDDTANEHLYKFISDSDTSIEKGQLYVANLEKGEWISLEIESHPELKKSFENQLDILIHARRAAKIVGATPLDRPEDIEIHPISKDVFVTLTNNKSKGNFHGSILKLMEENGDAGSLKFKNEYFLTGGEESGFSCPDNMAFDNRNNLWFTSDISGSSMKKKEYLPFKNNGLFVVPISGKNAGKVVQVASAPNNAEFTGPYFSPDYRSLFLSVQHPGEFSNDENYISHWPDGGDKKPKPSVIEIFLK